MDYIKKIICIEEARTRTQGLMPYYEFGKEYKEHKGGGCSSMSSLGLETTEGKDNGNWGQFVANPCFLASNDKTYEAMLRNYYTLLNMVRDGIKLRRVKTKEGEIIFTEDLGAFELNGECFDGGKEPDFLYDYAAYPDTDFYSTDIDSLREETKHIYRYTGKENISAQDGPKFVVLIKDYKLFLNLQSYLDGTNYASVGAGVAIGNNTDHLKWSRYCKVVDACIGKVTIPASIYNKHIKVPKSMPCADVEPYIEWLTNYQTMSADCCNARLYEDMGGEEFLRYLKNTVRGKCDSQRRKLEGLSYAVPYLSMSLLLTQNTTDVGVLTNIDGVEYEGQKTDKQRPHGLGSPTGFTIDEILMGTGTHTDRDLEVESVLHTLRNSKKYTDDKDNVLPGDFVKFGNPAGEMYACVKRDNEKFYKLAPESYTVTENGESVTYWRVVYVEDGSISRNDIYGQNNLNHAELPGPFATGLATQEEADIIVREQELHYSAVSRDVEVNPYVYMICVSLASWTMYHIGGQPQNSINGDGLQSSDVSDDGTRYPPSDDWRNASGKRYRTITTCASGIRIAETEEEETGEYVGKDYHYFFFVKYNNSPETPMKIPYETMNATNVYLVDSAQKIYRGDFIPEGGITADGRTFKVKYVVGGYFKGDDKGNYQRWVNQDLGDIYYEEYDLDREHVDYVALDGVDNVPVYSEYIDFQGAAKEFYSPIYNLYRTGNTATILRLTSGDIWSEDFNKTLVWSSYDAYLAKEEYLTGFSLPPKVNVNVTVDRGGVSAFEKHYKLAECNTMQDLVNYGNNFFNL